MVPVFDVENCEVARVARSVWRISIMKSAATQPARVIAVAISSTMDSTAKGADNDSVKPERPTLMLRSSRPECPLPFQDPKTDKATWSRQHGDREDQGTYGSYQKQRSYGRDLAAAGLP